MREEITSKWKIKIILVENNWNKSYSIEWIKSKHYWISENRMNSIIDFYWKDKLLDLLEEYQSFSKVQQLFDEDNSLNLSLDDFEEFDNNFSWVLTKEMIEIFNFLESFKKNYYLAWRTAISLYLKHRESIDFDIFSNWSNISLDELRKHILSYKKVQSILKNKQK